MVFHEPMLKKSCQMVRRKLTTYAEPTGNRRGSRGHAFLERKQDLPPEIALVQLVHRDSIEIGLCRIAFSIEVASTVAFLRAHQARADKHAQVVVHRPDSEGERPRNRAKVVSGEVQQMFVDAASRRAVQNTEAFKRGDGRGRNGSTLRWERNLD